MTVCSNDDASGGGGGGEGDRAPGDPPPPARPEHEVEGHGQRGTERFSFGPGSPPAATAAAVAAATSDDADDSVLDGSRSFSELRVPGGDGQGSAASSSAVSLSATDQHPHHQQHQRGRIAQPGGIHAPLCRPSYSQPETTRLEGFGRRGTFSERFMGSFSSVGSLDSIGRAMGAVRDLVDGGGANDSWGSLEDGDGGGGGGTLATMEGGGAAERVTPRNPNPSRPVEGYGRRGTNSERFMSSFGSFGNDSAGSFARAAGAIQDAFGQFDDSAEFDGTDPDGGGAVPASVAAGPPAPPPPAGQRRRGSGRVARRGSGAGYGRRGSGGGYRGSLGEDALAGAAAALRVSLSEAIDEDEEHRHDEDEEDREEETEKKDGEGEEKDDSGAGNDKGSGGCGDEGNGNGSGGDGGNDAGN